MKREELEGAWWWAKGEIMAITFFSAAAFLFIPFWTDDWHFVGQYIVNPTMNWLMTVIPSNPFWYVLTCLTMSICWFVLYCVAIVLTTLATPYIYYPFWRLYHKHYTPLCLS